MIRHQTVSSSAFAQRPTQAVILAGGRGTRLAPLTYKCPKPMIELHGKPFLEYLVEMLKEQGFTRILLLLGYMPEVIERYFGNGERWGISMEYSVSSVDDETGRRIKLAESRLDPTFLLMYCDNYWPMQIAAMWHRFANSNAQAQVTVYRNSDHYTRDNVHLDSEGYIVKYDKSRTAPCLSGVDIGFALLNRSVLDMLPDDNVSFEEVVYPTLAARHQLISYVSEHRYYSVGSHERLPLTEEFLRRQPAILLDRDGVLNVKMPQSDYVRTWREWQWLPKAGEALRLFKEAGYRTIIVTNQAGIARGLMTEADLRDIHQRMQEEAIKAGGEIAAIYCCPHSWDEGCECRKPQPGLLFQAQRDFHLDLSRTYFVGDSESDRLAANAAGCRWFEVSESVTLHDFACSLLNSDSQAHTT